MISLIFPEFLTMQGTKQKHLKWKIIQEHGRMSSQLMFLQNVSMFLKIVKAHLFSSTLSEKFRKNVSNQYIIDIYFFVFVNSSVMSRSSYP